MTASTDFLLLLEDDRPCLSSSQSQNEGLLVKNGCYDQIRIDSPMVTHVASDTTSKRENNRRVDHSAIETLEFADIAARCAAEDWSNAILQNAGEDSSATNFHKITAPARHPDLGIVTRSDSPSFEFALGGKARQHPSLSGPTLHLSDNPASAISPSKRQDLCGRSLQESPISLANMNEHLHERFPRPPSDRHDYADDEMSNQPPEFSEGIQQYYREFEQLSGVDGWVSRPEIPTSSELRRRVIDGPYQLLMQADDNSTDGKYPGDDYDDDDTVESNNLTEAWPSKNQYLKAQYNFCREESTFSLRNAIAYLQRYPDDTELDARGECSGIGIYDKARVKRLIWARNGLAVRMSFSTDRSRVNINWKTSKRLSTGSLIAITPTKDMFRSHIIPAVVAARPLSLIDEKIPQFDMFICYDAVFDPLIEYVIVEETSAFFEAQRHNLLALQRMTQEEFPLHEYLIDPRSNTTVGVASSLRPRDTTTDLAVFLDADNSHSLMNIAPALGQESNSSVIVDVLSDWPKHKFSTGPLPSLDESQMQALKQMLVSEVALIQGPPGTGKTHVSIAALKVILDEWKVGDPPILVSCQTNHALDQLLLHVSKFYSEFVRLGGRTADIGIKQRTLFAIRNGNRSANDSKTSNTARREKKKLVKEMKDLLAPFNAETGIFDHHLFYKYDLITKDQRDSIKNYTSGWHIGQRDPDSEQTTATGPLNEWLEGLRLASLSELTPESMDFHHFEEEELEDELLDEDAAEMAKQQDRIESLGGEFFDVAQKWSSSSGDPPLPLMDFFTNLTTRPQYSNLGKPPAAIRRYLYEFLVKQCKAKISDKLLTLIKKYNKVCKDHQMGIFESDLSIIKATKLVGLTTTGFSKYRPLVAASGAKIVMLEEAGESLECTVVPLFIPSIEQMIQVGDHKQLQPRPQKRSHEGMSWGISLFERLIGNGMEMRMLRKQRRMRSEISRLLRPVYGPDLLDHEKEDNRPVVPGMGGFNTWFMDHESREGKDAAMSTTNQQEAALIAEFAGYLTLNGVKADQISILTLYNGQRRSLNAELRKQRFLQDQPPIRVYTVDSYQGEENDIILLSLVRSNDHGIVGFAGNPNRVNVALSRAKQGLYMFGNRQLLENYGGDLWRDVFEILDDQGDWGTRISDHFTPHDAPEVRVGSQLFLVCDCGVTTHEADRGACHRHCARSHEPNTTAVSNALDFAELHGGCTLKCVEILNCGHQCSLPCHPTPHSEVVCNARCSRTLPCGHKCVALCRNHCRCGECKYDLPSDPPTLMDPPPLVHEASLGNTASFAKPFQPVTAFSPVAHAGRLPMAPPARMAPPSYISQGGRSALAPPARISSSTELEGGQAFNGIMKGISQLSGHSIDLLGAENTSPAAHANKDTLLIDIDDGLVPPTSSEETMPQPSGPVKKKGKQKYSPFQWQAEDTKTKQSGGKILIPSMKDMNLMNDNLMD